MEDDRNQAPNQTTEESSTISGNGEEAYAGRNDEEPNRIAEDGTEESGEFDHCPNWDRWDVLWTHCSTCEDSGSMCKAPTTMSNPDASVNIGPINNDTNANELNRNGPVAGNDGDLDNNTAHQQRWVYSGSSTVRTPVTSTLRAPKFTLAPKNLLFTRTPMVVALHPWIEAT